MNKKKSFLLLLFLVAISSILVSQSLSNKEVSGAATGQVKFFILAPNQYFTDDAQISNNTIVNTGLNITLLFGTNGSCAGVINVTYLQANPTGVDIIGNSSINRFLTVQNNLTCIYSTMINVTYINSDAISVNETTLRLYRFNNGTAQWDILPGSVDTVAKQVSGTTTHFSTFGAFGSTVAQTGAVASTEAGVSGGGGFTYAKLPIVTKAPPLDVLAEIMPGYATVTPGNYLLANIQITNTIQPGRKDISMSYFVVDSDGNEVPAGQETVSVETTASFVRKIIIPDGMAPGQYVLKVVAAQGGASAIGNVKFNISSIPVATERFFAVSSTLIAYIIIGFLLGVIAIYAYLHVKKDKEISKFIDNYRKYWQALNKNK